MNQFPQPQSDLSSILQTLSAYAAPPPLQQHQPQFHHPPPPLPHTLPNTDHEEGEVVEEEAYDPATSLAYQISPPAPLPHPPHPNRSTHPTSSDPHASLRPPTSSSSSSSSKPHLPPSTSHITTYPLALRHITTALLPHPHFSLRIRHLIHEQHKHEREWHRDRMKLVQQLGAREASRRKLDAVLASVGAGAKRPSDDDGDGGGKQRAELSEEQELRLFDRKVWKAQKEMVGAAEKELGRLGVPFFGGGGERWEGKREELEELRGKVLGLLNDLCGEDEGG